MARLSFKYDVTIGSLVCKIIWEEIYFGTIFQNKSIFWKKKLNHTIPSQMSCIPIDHPFRCITKGVCKWPLEKLPWLDKFRDGWFGSRRIDFKFQNFRIDEHMVSFWVRDRIHCAPFSPILCVIFFVRYSSEHKCTDLFIIFSFVYKCFTFNRMKWRKNNFLQDAFVWGKISRQKPSGMGCSPTFSTTS